MPRPPCSPVGPTKARKRSPEKIKKNHLRRKPANLENAVDFSPLPSSNLVLLCRVVQHESLKERTVTRTSVLWPAVILVALLAPATWADSISYDTATPTSQDDEPGTPTSPAAGKISAFGTYDVPAGTTVNSITMHATPVKGGKPVRRP